MQVSKSLRIFSDKILDYAGLFPPAKLSLEESYENFLKYRNEDIRWMLSNFICPVNKLDELNDLMKREQQGHPVLPLSLILKGNDSSEEFLNGIREELNLVRNFILQNHDRVEINCFELKLPSSEITKSGNENLSDVLNNVSLETRHFLNQDVFFFYEGILGDEWEKNTGILAGVVSSHNEKFPDSGFKLRTGGIEAASFPSSEQIVYTLRKCIEEGISFKATAGLHHPFRHYNDTVKARMHGFINLFGAGIIAYRHNITDKELVNMLEEEDPSEFKFTDEAFTYEGWEISNDEIALARKEFMISFGSCSVEEPIDDLKKSGLIKT